jgi:hypothetical protein
MENGFFQTVQQVKVVLVDLICQRIFYVLIQNKIADIFRVTQCIITCEDEKY